MHTNSIRYRTYTFGCRVNQAETEAIEQDLNENGLIQDNDHPQWIIVNTCAVTAKAEREARNLLYQIQKKHTYSDIIMTGCSASLWLKREKLSGKFPNVVFISNQDKDKIGELICNKISHNPALLTHNQSNNKYILSKRMMIKIQDGCHRFCSYCIVPYLRGLPHSTPIRKIISQVNRAEKSGIREVIFTAVNTEAYGLDNQESLVDLINNTLVETKIKRLSFGSIHPWSITSLFLKSLPGWISSNRFITFFHIPIQSGCNKVLELMKRNYTREQISESLIQIQKIVPHALLATDVIVGFPGENHEDFEKTYEFLKNSHFAKFHVFRYSERPGTAAYYMSKKSKKMSGSIISMWAKKLRDLSKEKYLQFMNKNIGRQSTVLVIKTIGDNQSEGLTDNQLPIFIDKKVLPGVIKRVKITGIKDNRLIGTFLES